MNNDLISREALKEAMRKAKRGHYAAFSDVTLQGIYRVIDNAPTVEPTFGLFRAMLCENCQAYATNRAIAKLADEYTTPPDTFTRDELEAWLYANAANNLDGNKRDQLFADDCEEIIKRLDGFERFVKDRREGKI